MKIFKDKKMTIEITSVEEWFKHCPPADPSVQWKDKRSAKEMARFWTDLIKQADFLLFLKKIKKDLTLNYAIPEIATKFDNYRNSRKNDLCVFATENGEEILISIEGKSDEPFGKNYVDKEWKLSINEKIKGSKSTKIDRLIGLYQRYNSNADFLKLRYQLSYWLAGTIDEAVRNKTNDVFLIVQEFHSDVTNREKIELNKCDLDFFINFISKSTFNCLDNNDIKGSIKNEFTKNKNLYIGKYQDI